MPGPWSVRALLITVALRSGVPALPQTQPVLLGILEDTPGHSADSPHCHDVRIVFHRDGDRWEAFPSSCSDEDCLTSITAKYPAEVTWTIAFDGRQLGSVTARTPPSFDFYSTIGQQQIIGHFAPPTVGKRSAQFGGFLGEAVYRPLVAVSQPNYRDPDGWKPAPLPKALLLVGREAFHQRIPRAENCTKGNPDQPVTRPYSATNIKLQKAYASNQRWFLVELSLGGNLCDGPPGEAFAPQWFVITPAREVRWIGSEMWLVDAADYDGDGHSEMVFSIDSYNRGGYRLFYDDFRHTATFEFSYH